MIGKILGAIAGEQAAKHIRGVSGPGGAMLGAGAAALIRRLGPLGLIAATVGGIALKRHLDAKKAAEKNTQAPVTETSSNETAQPGQTDV